MAPSTINTPLKPGKKNHQGEGGGRPSIFREQFKDLKDLENRINEYLESCRATGGKVLPTKAGLMLCLGTPSRETYNKYKKDPKYSNTLKTVETEIESIWNQALRDRQAAGPIFYLKNAFKEDYKDRYENDVTSGGKRIPNPILGSLTQKSPKSKLPADK